MSRNVLIAVIATIIVGLIALFMFAGAAQPLGEQGRTAQRWIEALCAEDVETLWTLSALPPDYDRTFFVERIGTYLRSGEVPFPCVGQVNFNLVRDIAVPSELSAEVTRAVQFSDVELQGTNAETAYIPLWAYQLTGGEWRIWAGVFGAARARAVGYGELAPILDSNGRSVGSIQIIPPVQVYASGGGALLAIPVRLTTLSRIWERSEAYLYVGQTPARRIDQVWTLPEEWRVDFLPPSGGYMPQNIQQTGRLWFSVSDLNAPITLAFTATTPFSGTMQSVFLDVPTADIVQTTPFNPFAGAEFAGIEAENPVFTVSIDTTGLLSDQITLECSRFVLVLVTEEWLRGTDCTFTEGFEQTLLPDEQQRVRVTFAGYGATDPAQFKALTYRRRDEGALIRYDLWAAPVLSP